MLEIILFCAVLFFIAILFYKQANEEFQILQLDAERLDTITTLYQDHSPIVVRGFQPPALGTQEHLFKRPHILQMSVGKMSLKQLLSSPQALAAYTMTPTTAAFLAKESGLKIWYEQHLHKKFLPSPYTQWLYSSDTYLWPHHRGLWKTTAFQTIVMPTQGTITLSLLLPKALPYLPPGWQGRQFTSLTLADTPLLAQIEFIDIKVRKGTFVVLPAHVLASISPDSTSEQIPWCFTVDIHHPISRIAGH